MARVGEAINEFFGIDDDFVRAIPARAWMTDLLIAVLLSGLSLILVAANLEIPAYSSYFNHWQSPAFIISAGVLIALRRRFPIGIMLLLGCVHLIVASALQPSTVALASMQVLYFLAIYTAMAFATRRDLLMLCAVGVLLSVAAWLVMSSTVLSTTGPPEYRQGLWAYLAGSLLNIAFFGSALVLGRLSWLQAKTTAELRESHAVVERQSAQLAEQAVLKERLRIARDLHDSVAHYISLIGIQTAAARRAMATKPDAASESLLSVEDMSRDAIAELRALLGSLREGDAPVGAGNSLDTVENLCRAADRDGLSVSYHLVGDPDAAHTLTPTQTGALVRIAQEALTNVRRHSTAHRVRVVVRLGESTELEITDDGHPVPGSSGSGLGLVGMRERVFALGGTLDAGPRATKGFRVLVRLPRRLGS